MVRALNAKSAVLESVDVMVAGDDAVEIGKALLTIEPAGQSEAQIDVVVFWQQKMAYGSGTWISGI
jgi:hypothetical protein